MLALLGALACATGSSCTPIPGISDEDRMLRVRVEADDEVRAEIDDVEVSVESRRPGASSWKLETSQRFTPDPSLQSGWPLQFRVESYDPNATYQATATSRDRADAVLIQTRVIADSVLRSSHELMLRFDRECLRRAALCSRTQACMLGECVDAREALKERTGAAPESQTTSDSAGHGQIVAAQTAASSCSEEGARSCAAGSDTQPLVCEQGNWREGPRCASTARCDSSSADTQGSCVEVAPECTSGMPGDRFCDAQGNMRECQDNRTALVTPCDDNEACVSVAAQARCACRTGYVPAAQGCIEANDCRAGGGCDPLTDCQMVGGKRACSACPSGFTGSGELGCQPLLSDLQLASGTLEPAFAPENTKYRVRVPWLAQQLELTATSSADATLTINNAAAELGKPQKAAINAHGETILHVTLSASKGAGREYELVVERSEAAQTYLKASNARAGDYFGSYVAAYGDTVVVTAPLEQCSAQTPDGPFALTGAGAAYVFVREAGAWQQQAYLKADEPSTNALFGANVAVWKDRIAVGAPGNFLSGFTSGTRAGAVYVYTRTQGQWTLEQKLTTGAAAGSGDSFGFRVALREDVLVVSAPFDSERGTLSGAVYVFAREGGSWKQQQRLTAPTPIAQAQFGGSVRLDDATLAVASCYEDIEQNTRAGAVYTYTRNGGEWSFLQRVLAPTPRAQALFGIGLAVRGDLLVVGAPHNPGDMDSNHSGEVNVYQRSGAKYVPSARLEATSPRVGDRFGQDVAIARDTLLVAAPGDARAPGGAGGELAASGALYTYARADQNFMPSVYVKAKNAGGSDGFGNQLATTDDFVVAGVVFDDSGAREINGNANDDSLTDSGAAYVLQ